MSKYIISLVLVMIAVQSQAFELGIAESIVSASVAKKPKLETTTDSINKDQWCIWDGEEYIKDKMSDAKTWLDVVYELHTEESTDVVAPFEGVGSCRFIDRNLATEPMDVITQYSKTISYIIASRAYLKFDAAIEIVLPKAYYSAGSNLVYVEKDFYAMKRPLCEKQKEQMIQIGKNSEGIRFTDIELKKNKFGGVSAVINGNTTATNYLGLCHFHQ